MQILPVTIDCCKMYKHNSMVFNYNPQEKRLIRKTLATWIKYVQYIIHW